MFLAKNLLSLFSSSKFFLPFIIIQLALEIALKGSINGPEGITKPFPSDCLELKHIIEKSGLIEKS